MKTESRKLARGLLLGCAAAILTSSCGGGGGGGAPPGTISFSVNAMSFKAVGPWAAAPAAQPITATVTGITTGTVYYKVVANNAVQNGSNGFFTVTDVTIAGDSGTASVIPAIPSSIGAGTFKGTITVTACLNDSSCQTGQLAGSPQTIPVEYDIGSGVDGDTVTPSVVTAGTGGNVILRGRGFTRATSVSFGSVPASSITVVSDSEIDASYPPLPAGAYPVTIDSGRISYSASLDAVSSPAFTATTITYPSGIGGDSVGQIGTEYDARRTALFILFRAETYTNPTLVRYAFDGSQWGSPTEIAMAGLVAVHLSSDGTRLLALVAPDSTHTSMVELDPVTLAQTNVTTVSNPREADHPCGFALANDGNAFVSLSYSPGFAFGTSSRTFTPLSAGPGCESLVASGNGAVLAMYNSTYDASTGLITQGGAQTSSATTADFAGDKFLDYGAVYSGTGRVLGYVDQGLADGDVINPAGTRAYSLTQDSNDDLTLSTFDLTATPAPAGSQYAKYPVLGTPITLASSITEGLYLGSITPDGATIFLAGPLELLVQPVPP
jgi:hypothetical protein